MPRSASYAGGRGCMRSQAVLLASIQEILGERSARKLESIRLVRGSASEEPAGSIGLWLGREPRFLARVPFPPEQQHERARPRKARIKSFPDDYFPSGCGNQPHGSGVSPQRPRRTPELSSYRRKKICAGSSMQKSRRGKPRSKRCAAGPIIPGLSVPRRAKSPRACRPG